MTGKRGSQPPRKSMATWAYEFLFSPAARAAARPQRLVLLLALAVHYAMGHVRMQLRRSVDNCDTARRFVANTRAERLLRRTPRPGAALAAHSHVFMVPTVLLAPAAELAE